MRHAVFVEKGRVEWRETPAPVLQGPGEALVRPLVVGRCDLDVGYLSGVMPMPSGAPIGHEIIGEVVSVGEGVRSITPGTRVFVPAQISCGVCASCRRGATARCLSVPFGASYGMGREGDFGGGLADLVRVPFADAMLSPLPEGADPVSLIGAADMAADAWRAVAPQLAAHPEAAVLVLGGMPAVIGLYAAALAVALGASCVHYVDDDATRRDAATLYGAQARTDVEAGRTYDIVVVARPFRADLQRAFSVVAPAGVVTSVAPTVDGGPDLDTRALYHRGATWIIGRPDCRHAHDGVLAAWASCGFCAGRMPTRRVVWDEAPEAWASDALYVAAVHPDVAS